MKTDSMRVNEPEALFQILTFVAINLNFPNVR